MLSSRKSFGEKEKKFDRKRFLRILGISLGLGFLFAWIVRSWIITPFVPENEEMNPNFPKGKRVYINRWVRPDSLFLGDIVLLYHPTQKNRVLLARIIGKPGDTISIQDKIVIRNGIPEVNLPFQIVHTDKRESFPSSHSARDNFSPQIVEARTYFLLCDNRDECVDSRDFGPISFENILGKVL